MPRIESGSSAAGEGFSIPYKVIGLVALISCGAWYGLYHYERLNPAPKVPLAMAARAKISKEKKQLGAFERLNLTPEQAAKLETLAEKTTDPKTLRRQANKLLTPEQKARAKNLAAEAKAERELKKREREERMAKLYPNGQLAVVQAKQKEIRAQAQARRKASQPAR